MSGSDTPGRRGGWASRRAGMLVVCGGMLSVVASFLPWFLEPRGLNDSLGTAVARRGLDLPAGIAALAAGAVALAAALAVPITRIRRDIVAGIALVTATTSFGLGVVTLTDQFGAHWTGSVGMHTGVFGAGPYAAALGATLTLVGLLAEGLAQPRE